MHLEPAHIHSWKDLVGAFVKQYKYNIDMAPDRMQLQSMTKKGVKTFKEYAQTLREVAAQVERPLHDKEMVAMFIDTLQSPFYEHMVGSVSLNFADMVIIGERIEFGFKSGKIAQGPLTDTNTKKPRFVPGRRKATSIAPHWGNNTMSHFRPRYQQSTMHFVANTTPIYHPRARLQGFPRPRALYHVPPKPNNAYHHNVVPQPNQGQNQILTLKRNSKKSFLNFTPIPMTYTELLLTLLHNSLVTISPMKSVQPPHPKNYDATPSVTIMAGQSTIPHKGVLPLNTRCKN